MTTTGVRKTVKPKAKKRIIQKDSLSARSGRLIPVRTTQDSDNRVGKTLIHKMPPISGDGDVWTVVKLLNLENSRGTNYMSLSNEIRKGFSVLVMDNLKMAGVERIYRDRIIPPRTLQHRATKGEPLSPTESERAYRVATIVGLADQVFANHEKGLRWLHKPMKVLDGKAPLDVLDNEPGARLVEDLLGRLDEGYFA